MLASRITVHCSIQLRCEVLLSPRLTLQMLLLTRERSRRLFRCSDAVCSVAERCNGVVTSIC
jgi:hypothetical protein